MSHFFVRLLYWSPRILAAAFAVFLSLFALDVFNEAHGFWHTALALSIHLIPAAIVLVILAIAWRWEWIGAALFVLAAAFYAWYVLPRHIGWVGAISGPLLVIAALFLADWMEREKLRTAS